jgi:hypothetical protein
VPKVVSSADGSGSNQDQIGPRSETSTNDEAKHRMEKGLEEIADKQNKAPGKETEIKAKAVASFQQQPNRTVRFDKSNHPVPIALCKLCQNLDTNLESQSDTIDFGTPCNLTTSLIYKGTRSAAELVCFIGMK